MGACGSCEKSTFCCKGSNLDLTNANVEYETNSVSKTNLRTSLVPPEI